MERSDSSNGDKRQMMLLMQMEQEMEDSKQATIVLNKWRKMVEDETFYPPPTEEAQLPYLPPAILLAAIDIIDEAVFVSAKDIVRSKTNQMRGLIISVAMWTDEQTGTILADPCGAGKTHTSILTALVISHTLKLLKKEKPDKGKGFTVMSHATTTSTV